MLTIPVRKGEPPKTTTSNPHEQLTQNPDADMYQLFKTKLFTFNGVSRRPSIISVPGSEALWLNEGQACNCADGFMIGREFAHIHPAYDGSLHMALSADDFQQVIESRWGERHPLAGLHGIPETIAMVYAPRTEEEMEVVLMVVAASLDNAKNKKEDAV